MNREIMKRLEALEEQAAVADEGYEFFREEEDEHGDVAAYVLLMSGRRYTPNEFDQLMKARPKVVFVPISPKRHDAEAEAYWACTEARGVTWADLQAENAGGPVAFEPMAWLTQDVEGLDKEQVELARRYAERLDAAAPFWEEMLRRSERLSGEGGTQT